MLNNSEFSKNSLVQVAAPDTKGIYFVEITIRGDEVCGEGRDKIVAGAGAGAWLLGAWCVLVQDVRCEE